MRGTNGKRRAMKAKKKTREAAAIIASWLDDDAAGDNALCVKHLPGHLPLFCARAGGLLGRAAAHAAAAGDSRAEWLRAVFRAAQHALPLWCQHADCATARQQPGGGVPAERRGN